MNLLYPKEEHDSIYDIPFERLYDDGLQGVIFDIDNTLVPHGAPADDKVIDFFDRLHRKGIKTCLLSNNKDVRVSPFAYKVRSMYVCNVTKPQKSAYKKALEKLDTDIDKTIYIGDQIFTDILGANRMNIYSILVKPISPKEEIQIRLKRILEKIILFFYHQSIRRENGNK